MKMNEEKETSSSISSQESEESDLDLKGRIKKIGNIYPSKGEQGLIISETGIAPAITSRKKGGGKVGLLVAIDASGPVTTIDSPTKSTLGGSSRRRESIT